MKEFPVAFGPKKTPGLIENTSRGFDPRATERYHPQIRSWRGSTYEEGCFVCGALDYWQRDCLQARQSKAKQGPRTLGMAQLPTRCLQRRTLWTVQSNRRNWAYGNRNYDRRGYGSYSYPGGYAERERSPPPSAGAASSAEPPSHRPAVTMETRTSQGIIREETVQAPDGTMYTEYTFPDGHTEWDYW